MHFIIDNNHISFYFVVNPMWKEHRGEEAMCFLRFYAFFIFGFFVFDISFFKSFWGSACQIINLKAVIKFKPGVGYRYCHAADLLA